MRLIDRALSRLKDRISTMALVSESLVDYTIDSYVMGMDVKSRVYETSEKLRELYEEIDRMSDEIIARYSPMASDLRFVKSCIEISYDFFRFGRYALDISEVTSEFGNHAQCRLTEEVRRASELVKRMIRDSITSFLDMDMELATSVKERDSEVDRLYRAVLKGSMDEKDVRCAVMAVLVMRYLERIADHTTYIADAVSYVVKGRK